MSAINPASFVSPPGALSNPMAYGQEPQTDRRHHDGRTYSNGRDGMDTGRDLLTNQMLRNTYAENYQPFGQAARHPDAGIGGFGLQAQPDPFSAYGPSAYGPMETGYVDYAGSPRIPAVPGDWTSRFQGLSLGS